MTSKARKKELKKKFKEQVKNHELEVYVIARDISDDLILNKLVPQMNSFEFNAILSKTSPTSYVIYQPTIPANRTTIRLGTVDEDLMAQISTCEQMTDQPIGDLVGYHYALVSAKVNKSDVNDLLHMATLRALGPLTKGIAVFTETCCVLDDWVIWSSDYGGTMANVIKMGVDAPLNYAYILQENPDLVYKKPTSFIDSIKKVLGF